MGEGAGGFAMVDLDDRNPRDRNPRDRNLGDRNPRPRTVRRRTLAALAGAALASPALAARAQSNDGGPAVRRAIDRFAAAGSQLPGPRRPDGGVAGRARARRRAGSWAARSRPSSWRATCATSRTAASPGRAARGRRRGADAEQPGLPQPHRHDPGESVLEAMITHSDNTATDMRWRRSAPTACARSSPRPA